jgi:formylglycine-generating enzyme required for sulfatase activity
MRLNALLGAALATVVLCASCDSDGAWLGTPRLLLKQQPTSATVYDTQTATFAVEVTGPGTILYMWETSTDGLVWITPPGTSDLASYTTSATTCAESGTLFRCWVTNSADIICSDVVTLTVTPAPYRIVDLATDSVSTAADIPDLFTNDDYKTTKIVLKLIQPGTFQMGDEVDDGIGNANELPVHTVNITKPFYMGVFEVTQRQWFEIEGTWPSNFTTDPDRLPVEQVSWDDCQGYLATVSSATSFAVRLPTEAEWEYSCKAGTHTMWSHGSVADDAYVWCQYHAGGTTNEVGTRLPNPWGLYNMHGNVGEFCEDYYDSPYISGEATDPTGPATGTSRAYRGGDFASFHEDCRSSFRGLADEADTAAFVGFRIAASVPSLP